MDTLTIILIAVAAFGWIANFLIFSENQELARKYKAETEELILNDRLKEMDHSISHRIEELERELNYWREDIDTRVMKVEIDLAKHQRISSYQQRNTGKQK